MGLNAFDGALATLPGSDGDLKLAQGMVQADFKFNDQISLSGFVQYDSKESILPGRGTFGRIPTFLCQDLTLGTKILMGLRNPA